MKKLLLVVLIVTMVTLTGTVVTFAQKACSWMGAMADKKSDGEKRAMVGMNCAMMKKPSLVAISDGGVVVLVGNKLLKYNRNLELKNEAEIKLDTKELMQNYPMKSGEGSAVCPTTPDGGEKGDK